LGVSSVDPSTALTGFFGVGGRPRRRGFDCGVGDNSREFSSSGSSIRSIILGVEGLPRRFGVGVVCPAGSESGSGRPDVLAVLPALGRGVRLMGVPAFLFLPSVGIGVPFDLRVRVFRPGVTVKSGPSSTESFSGTVVVVVRAGRALGKGLGEGNSRRRGLPWFTSSVSTVTNNFCGDALSPTSSSNVCFLGELPRATNLSERWLRVTRRAEYGAIELAESLRGSGDDMMSKLGVSGLAMWCQRRVKGSVAVTDPDARRLDIGEGH
jgi:hypothetical protein